MKLSISLWQAAGFAAATFGGTILHFLYDWTGGSTLVSPFSGVNESTWEHMKLLFWPLFAFALAQRPFFKDRKNYWWVKLAGILLGLLLIPALFYTYNGAFGKSPDWINITIFYISAALVFLFDGWAFKGHRMGCKAPRLAIAALCLTAVLFVWFTFAPPRIPLFRDPLTGGYGRVIPTK